MGVFFLTLVVVGKYSFINVDVTLILNSHNWNLLMTYKCKNCGHSFRDVHYTKVTKVDVRNIRCPRCGLRRMKVKYSALKWYLWFIISLVTGIIGAWVGIWICSALGGQGAELMFGLVGFGVGFFVPSIYWLVES